MLWLRICCTIMSKENVTCELATFSHKSHKVQKIVICSIVWSIMRLTSIIKNAKLFTPINECLLRANKVTVDSYLSTDESNQPKWRVMWMLWYSIGADVTKVSFTSWSLTKELFKWCLNHFLAKDLKFLTTMLKWMILVVVIKLNVNEYFALKQ